MTYFTWRKGDNPNAHLSSHFTRREFECQCNYPDCVTQRVSSELIARLEEARQEVGLSFTITSGFRCQRHQSDLVSGGTVETVSNSEHTLGNAADVACSSMQALTAALVRRFRALGFSAKFIHVDTRADKLRTWAYK